MPTKNKAEKPTILTESDQILNDLKAELTQLKTRMSSIEIEQEQNRILVERLSFQEELSNEVIESHRQEVTVHKENYQVIASVMNQLRSPVSNVMSNLSGVISDIDDQETKKTLQECMNTASNVLNSFEDVEDFCRSAGGEVNIGQVAINIRDFFRDELSVFQTSQQHKQMSFRLLVDKQVPQHSTLCSEIVKSCLTNLLNEIQHLQQKASTIIRISIEPQGEKYGCKIEDLVISIEWEGASSIEWGDTWLTSIKSNHEILLDSGFNLLKTRELIRKSGGHLQVVSENNRISSLKLFTPLTY